MSKSTTSTPPHKATIMEDFEPDSTGTAVQLSKDQKFRQKNPEYRAREALRKKLKREKMNNKKCLAEQPSDSISATAPSPSVQEKPPFDPTILHHNAIFFEIRREVLYWGQTYGGYSNWSSQFQALARTYAKCKRLDRWKVILQDLQEQGTNYLTRVMALTFNHHESSGWFFKEWLGIYTEVISVLVEGLTVIKINLRHFLIRADADAICQETEGSIQSESTSITVELLY